MSKSGISSKDLRPDLTERSPPPVRGPWYGQSEEVAWRSLIKAYKPIVRNNQSKMVPNMVDLKNAKQDSEIEYF